jgi:pyruvate,orthophosphate dikinase
VKRLIYAFGGGKAEGSARLRDLLGGKGAGLAEMSRIGVPVPPGFTLTTDVCRARSDHPGAGLFAAPGLRVQFDRALARLEALTGRRLGDPDRPLLLSVRSGAKFSMPGMMDTVLNLGLTQSAVEGLARESGSSRFALDSRRRFIAMFGNVVDGIEKDAFEEMLRERTRASKAASDRELKEDALRELIASYLDLYRRRTGVSFPEDPFLLLTRTCEAVFRSWNTPRAATYRKSQRIPDDLGTACTVQAMVFGNRGAHSGTGVGFTRDPSTGARESYGEYLPDAQGEDVVAGARTPMPLTRLEEELPQVYRQLRTVTGRLERHYRDVQDFEFTVEQGKLYLLQTRTGKRSAAAALKIAVDMVHERLIGREEAVLRVPPESLDQLLKPVFDEKARKSARALARGLPAGPGCASGRIFFNAEDAVREAPAGPVILVRQETNPDDIHGMLAAGGILTATGGLTSHAAVVGRGLGKVCVVGCAALEIGPDSLTAGGAVLKAGDFISLDGFTGDVMPGQISTQPSEILQVLEGARSAERSELYRLYRTFMGWADGFRRLGVRANADRPEDARVARLLGAEGVGLCRTEHMFFGEERIGKMLAMIVAETKEERRRALDALFPLQKEDFKSILRAMQDLPVTIRTLDPPLHEFLPHDLAEARRRGAETGLDPDRLWSVSRRLREVNPMLGHRGCRLGITHPELTEMQARAIFAAARELAAEGIKARPEVMIPLVGFTAEFRDQKDAIRRAAKEFSPEGNGHGRIPWPVGTMIEVPRAALIAGEIAAEAEFFSFGTNDLTQMLLGFSRDDYGKFIAEYVDKKILPADPFQTIDRQGVGAVVRQAVRGAREAKPHFKLGVCGEHGGDPESIGFFHEAGLDYVSCSPYRVPVARLAAAQAALRASRAGLRRVGASKA